jgi:hypothetical protein
MAKSRLQSIDSSARWITIILSCFVPSCEDDDKSADSDPTEELSANECTSRGGEVFLNPGAGVVCPSGQEQIGVVSEGMIEPGICCLLPK